MKKHLVRTLAVMVITVGFVGLLVAARQGTPEKRGEAPPEYRFVVETLVEGMPQPMELEIAPDGRIFFNEIKGKLKIYKPATREVVEAGELQVFNGQENGFLGFALDPNFARNNWIYLLYSPKDFKGQHLSRFVMQGDKLDMASEKIMLKVPEQRLECCHHAGSVEFGPDGNLYFSLGDNVNPFGSDGYGPFDDRPSREPWDAGGTSANMNDLRGKILRIRPTPEGGYTIPNGNLFPKDGSAGRPEIYVMGCRNPWRISLDPMTGFLYWGEVGPDAGGDSDRGPRGYDEINQARHAGYFGWPFFVGNNYPYARYNFDTKTLGEKFDPARPVNESRNNTGGKILPPAQPAFIYYPGSESKEFPDLKSGGRTACAGPVFHFRPSFQKTRGFPQHFDNCLLFFDWQRPHIKWARLDKDSRLVGIEPFTAAVRVAGENEAIDPDSRVPVIRRPADALFGPDGCLYMIDYGRTWGENKDSKLLKISYHWGNLPPVAVARADNAAGREPLTVQLTSEGSKDHEGDPLRYEWQLHPGGKIFSREASPKLTLDKVGNYIIGLRVTDRAGNSAATSLPVQVGNARPEVRFLAPQAGDFFTPGKAVKYRLAVRDTEDGAADDADDIFDPRMFLTTQWLGGDGKPADVALGLAAMMRSDCFNCHALDQKIVGPPLYEIAKRYRGQAGALEASVQRVQRGSTGVWSELPMLPHENQSVSEITTMVRWIYDLDANKKGPALTRGLAGTITAPKDDKLRTGIIGATYTDTGRAPAGSLTGKATVKLRSRRLEAEVNDAQVGCKTMGNHIGAIDHGHSVRFTSLNLTDSASVTCRVASAGAGGIIEFRGGAKDGALLASVEVKPTGGWDKWIELTAPLQPTEARTDVFVVFVNPDKGGLMNLDWLQFNPR